VDTIVLDKTGTVTSGRMSLVEVVVAEGTERGRRGESIAGSTQHRRGLGDLTTERRDQTSLANSGFTTHEHQSPLPCGCMTQMFAQVIEGLLALE